ncbi:hypothetical protein HJG60_011347 [Phyllostomus discolor]|uniref:Uncharacterized protein n=1 Tax=Phyllostomus discolor TaxID=89673 RepID=A0A834E5C2_9CHIR|nr:hypothetical protein HJG60_011347 [Phyllostomus discolor]
MNSSERLGVSPVASSLTGVFNQRSGALFPRARTLGCVVYLTPQLFLPVYLHSDVGLLAPRGTCYLAESSLPGHPSPRLLPVWRNVSSFTPWLWYFPTVQFSVSSGYFLFLNLSSFWLCEEAQCIYLRLHLGWKF